MCEHVVVLGSGGVGKSAVTLQFVNSHFVEEYDPTIEDTFRKQVSIDDEACVMEILDTGGYEEYGYPYWHSYARQNCSFLLIYSSTSRYSFEEILQYVDSIKRVKDIDTLSEVSVVLVGNKSDLEEHREVTTAEGQALADELGIPFFETSARTRLNIEECFFQVVRQHRLQIAGPPMVPAAYFSSFRALLSILPGVKRPLVAAPRPAKKYFSETEEFFGIVTFALQCRYLPHFIHEAMVLEALSSLKLPSTRTPADRTAFIAAVHQRLMAARLAKHCHNNYVAPERLPISRFRRLAVRCRRSKSRHYTPSSPEALLLSCN